MYSFLRMEPVCCSMSSSNCRFLTCIQISQEAGQVVWYSHLLEKFPQSIVIQCQFAEECSEAVHAALKLRRALTGENPTPVSVQDAEENLLEELTDIVICVDVLALDFYRSEEKAVRWINRLDSRTEKRDET